MKEKNMNKASVKFVGTEENPIHIYWNVSNRKTDEYLLLLSICSGSYGIDYLDKDSFEKFCNSFFRYAKKNNDYDRQFRFVLSNGNKDCAHYLKSLLFKKWNIAFECDFDEIIDA